ncbi:hypothetical protein ABT329_38345, partial [Streptomyces minutiscleroticus]
MLFFSGFYLLHQPLHAHPSPSLPPRRKPGWAGAQRTPSDRRVARIRFLFRSAAEKWVVTAARDIVNPQADKCLDVKDNNSANGTR